MMTGPASLIALRVAARRSAQATIGVAAAVDGAGANLALLDVARGVARTVGPLDPNPGPVVPSVFAPSVAPAVAEAVRTTVARVATPATATR